MNFGESVEQMWILASREVDNQKHLAEKEREGRKNPYPEHRPLPQYFSRHDQYHFVSAKSSVILC
jgi:hypothetical protein